MNQINSIPELLEYVKNTKQHLFYIGPVYGTVLLNLHQYMPTFEYIACCDPFHGRLPNLRVPNSLKNHRCLDIYECQTSILEDPQVIAYIKSKDKNPNVTSLNASPKFLELCKKNSLNWWGATPQLYEQVGSKVELIDILKKIDIPFIPNICSRIESYQHLMEIGSKLGSNSLVVQDPNGMGGFGTMFVASQEDYKTHQKTLENGKVHKIMVCRRLKSLAITGVATHAGTVLGPLLAELIGHQHITPNRGGYCGDELRVAYYEDHETDMKVRREVPLYAERLGNYLYKELGYRGVFGFDFVADDDTKEVFLMEVNPRFAGTNNISELVYEANNHRFPIFLFHCLEFMGVKINIDISALNREWIGLEHYQTGVSNIVFKKLKPNEYYPCNFPAGMWKIINGTPEFTGRIEFDFNGMKEDEAFMIPHSVTSHGSLIMRRSCQNFQFKLTEEFQSLIYKFLTIRRSGEIPKHS